MFGVAFGCGGFVLFWESAYLTRNVLRYVQILGGIRVLVVRGERRKNFRRGKGGGWSLAMQFLKNRCLPVY